MDYPYLKLIVDTFEDLDPKSIQKSVNAVLKRRGFRSDYTTENYVYSFAKALREQTGSAFFLSQGEISVPGLGGAEYLEGRRVAVLVERIERRPEARLECIAHFGAICAACGFDFEERYGSIGRGFIHVHHHRLQLAKTSGRHKVNPTRDLIPLCPNCHAMVHSQRQMLSVPQLKKIIADSRKPLKRRTKQGRSATAI